LRETSQTGVHAANDLTSFLDFVERRTSMCGQSSQRANGEQRAENDFRSRFKHSISPRFFFGINVSVWLESADVRSAAITPEI
jgi:hypothetical protein